MPKIGWHHSKESKRKMSKAKRPPMSEKTKRKISEANRNPSAETRRKMSEAKKNMSAETRRKMSEAKKNMSAETRRKMSKGKKGKKHPMYGKHHSEGARRKMSKAKRPPMSEEARHKISEANRNRSEETKRKMSEARKGHVVTEETRRKISEANRNPSAETRRKISEALKGKMAGEKHPMFGKHRSDETRRKISEGLKGKHYSEERRRKMSDLWKDPEHTSKMGKAFHTSPNSYEWKIIELCFTHQLGFDFVGDFQKCINGKCPDFINEEKKQIIETYSTYFKINQYGSESKYRIKRQRDMNDYDIIFLNEFDINAEDWRERCLFKIRNNGLCEHPKYWDETKYEKEIIERNIKELRE